MSAEVGQQNTPLPGDTCDVTQIQDEDLLRKMWQTTDDFGRKKEIRARMYKLREARLREFYTTGEVLKDVQSVDPTAVSVSIREETPKRGGTHYRQLVVGELRGDVESSATVTTHYETTSTSGGTVTKQRTEEVKTIHNNGQEVVESKQHSSTSSRLPRLNVTTRCSESSQENKMTSSSNNDNRITTERQTSNTDTKIMSELQKLDTFLSTTGVETPTPTPDSIRGSAFDGNNWTVVSSKTSGEDASKAIKEKNAVVQEFVFESGEGDGPRSKTVIAEYHQPGSETTPEVHAVMKQTASHAQYSTEDGSSSVTRSSKTTSSYSVSHQQRRISSDNSLAHEAFARSLRSPERRMYDSNTSTRTSSKSSLDASIGRGSPERPASTRSPRPSVTEQRNVRSSPEKERSAPSSPTRFNRGSPTRASPEKIRGSPTRDTVDKCSPVRSSPERKFSRSSPEKQSSPTREITERRVYQSSSSTTSSSVTAKRRTSQTSPQRLSPTRDTPQRKNSQPSSPKKEVESERRTSQTRRPSTKDEPQRRNSQTKPETSARDSPEKDRSSSPEKSPSPTRFSSSSSTRLTSNTVSKRKLSSASSRASAKRAGTPGASPNASPTRADTRDDKTQESSSEDDSQDETFISEQQKETSEVLNVSAEEDSTQISEVLSHTLLTTAMNESLSTSMKTNSLNEISSTKTTEVEISGNNTLPRKKSSIKEPVAPQLTPQSSPETAKKSPETEISGTGTLPRKKSSLKSPSTPQTTPQASPEAKSTEKATDFRSTLKNFEMRSSPVTTPDKPRSILRQDHSPKPVKPTVSPSEPDDSSRSLKNGTVGILNVSVVEQQLEMTPCEEVEPVETEPVVPVTPVTKKNTVQERTARRRSRDYVSDEDTSGRESSSSPIRKHPSRQQAAPKSVQKSTPVSASPQRPTKLPVASNKHDTGINSPDRCCGRQHGDHDKPWRQSPASSPVSFKRKPLNSTASPVSSPERKPMTPQRRRPASRSPSTSPDRPHEATTRPGRKSPPQKCAQTSPRSPPGKHVTPAASPARRVESPAGKRQVTERTSSAGRLRSAADTQRTTSLVKPSTRGASSPTKVDSPVGRGARSPTKIRPAVVDDADESPPQEFRVEETSEDEVAKRTTVSSSRIATSTSRRADVVRKVQGSQPTSPTKPTARSQPVRVPANTTSRVPRVEPVAQRPASRVPTATAQPQKKLSDTSKPRPTRTDSDKSIGCKRTVTSTVSKQTVTKTAAKTDAQKVTGVRKQTNNVSQISSRFTSNNNTTTSKLQRPQATTSKKSGVPTLRVPAGKPVQNGHTPGPVESEDEVESTFSTEEDETVTELEEVRYSSHTVDDTEDEDFKTRVNTCGASLKVGTTDIVQLRSSRDSSPENRPQRFADHVSEPESDFDTRKREPTPLEVVIRSEQITDLDEENEVEPSLLSVADRVSRFLTPGTMALLQSEKKKMQINETGKSTTLDSPNAVRRARAMFETIANSPAEAAPKQTVPDILSRPSIFDSPTRGRSPVPVTSVKKNIQSFEQETVEEKTLVSETEEDKYSTKVTQQKEDESKFNTYNKNETDKDAKYKKEPSDDEVINTFKEPVKMDETPRKSSVCDESLTTSESKFVSTATLTTSRKQQEEKPRAVVAPRQESPVRTKDGATKQKPAETKPASGGKFGVTLRKTPSTIRMENKTVEQSKTTSTTTTVIEGIVIEQTTDIKLLEQMMEKATDYDERRRLRAQIREVRRLGPAAVSSAPARKTSSPTRQVKPSESERRPSNSTPARAPETSRQSPTRQSPTRRSSSPTKPINEEVTRKSSNATSPTRRGDEPTRKSSGATSPTRRGDEPTRKSSGATSPTRRGDEPTRKNSGATSPTRRAPKDEEDGNRMSSTFIRQASKKFEDEARRSSTSTIKKDESKFSTFTRQSSSKKVVAEDESRFNTFTRTSSSKKIESEEVPSVQRKSSKSEITIELAKPSTATPTASAARKPSVPSAVPGVPREADSACSVTSSYGVGPTDENGRPLFGLRALRRSQQQEPGSVVLEQPASDPVEVKDTTGRPLFGLRAIKREGSPRSSDPSPAREQSPAPRDLEEEEVSPKSHVMPERAPSNGQLRDLVHKHEQQARGSPESGSSPPQKPRAKLRDSFITAPQEARGSNALKSKEEALTSRTQRSSALRAIIQKHESITDSEQTSKVVGRKDVTRTDKSQFSNSVTVDSVRETSPKVENEPERESPKPVVEASRRHSGSAPPEQVKRGILKKPRDSPERSAISQTSSTTTTAVSSATINLRRVDDASVNKIIEDTRKRSSASRSPPDGSTNSSFELESPRAVAEQLRSVSSVQIEKCRISPERDIDEEKVIMDEDGGETRVRTTHREEVDGNSTKSFTSRTAVTQRTSPRGAEERFSSSTSTTVRTSSSSRDSPSKDPAAHSMARVGRSGSVKALQQRFQQAAAGSNDTKQTRGYQKAGLIFRTNSFQHTNGCGPQGNKSKESSPRRDESFDSEGEGSPSTARRTSNSEARTSVSMEVNLSGCTSSPSPTSKSFLGNETRVTGVQDILTRMREADNQEVVAGESEEDREARSLLNKFLGAQVLLQGMEPLVNAQSPGLVSQVERQRLVVSTSSTGKEELSTKSSSDDLESIWDEKQLKQLLEACEDYDTRRKIRARLRVVMAENKVTSGSEVREFESTQVGAGGEAVMSSVRGELLPFIVEQLKTSLERGTPAPGSAAHPGACGGGVNGVGVVGGPGASGAGSSISSDDGPAFDSGTESGEDPRTPSSQTEIQMDDNADSAELSCFMEGLKNSFESRNYYGGGAEAAPRSDQVAELPPDVIGEVHAALAKLRGSLQIAAIRGEIVDTDRSEALMSLITRLQTSLQRQEDQPPPPPVPPPWQQAPLSPPNVVTPPVPAPRKKRQNRHTVGVCGEELVDARKHYDDHFSPSSSPTSTAPSPGLPNMDHPTPSTRSAFRPVHFSPMRSPSHSSLFNSSAKPFTQQAPLTTKPIPPPRPFPPPLPKAAQPRAEARASNEREISPKTAEILNNGEPFEIYEPVVASTKPRQRAASWTDDPSHLLFTPAESVQIAIHKAAINKQISQEEENRKNEVKFTADSLVLDALNDAPVAISKDDVIHHFPAPVVHSPVPKPVPAPVLPASMQPTPVVAPVQKVAPPVQKAPLASPAVQPAGPSLFSPSTPTKVVAPVRPNLPIAVVTTTTVLENHDVPPQRTKPVVPQPTVKQVQATVQKVESLKQTSHENVNKPSGKPLPASQASKPEVNVKQPEIKVTPAAILKDKSSLKEPASFESTPKTKINFNIMQEEKPVPQSVIWGSILNSVHTEKPHDDEDNMSSAQKLLQIASNRNDSLSDSSSRSSRSERRRKLKRANTIDIPKPLDMIDLEDSDEENSGDECEIRDHSPNAYRPVGKLEVPAPGPFIPKTENDRKFLAFLDRHSPVGDAKPAFVAQIRGGHPWTNRFSNLKTNFEHKAEDGVSIENVSKEVVIPKVEEVSLPARKFWSKADDSLAPKSQKTGPRLSKQSSSNLRKMFEEREAQQKQQVKKNLNTKPVTAAAVVEKKSETAIKPPWVASEQESSVVVGSLTVSSGAPAHTVNARRKLFSAPVSVPPLAPVPTSKPPQPTKQVPKISESLHKLEELQRIQQEQYMQQKQQQLMYQQQKKQEQLEKKQRQQARLQQQQLLKQKQQQVIKQNEIRGPAPISKFSHAQNSAFRPPEKRSNSIPDAVIPASLTSVNLVKAAAKSAQHAPVIRQHSDEITNQELKRMLQNVSPPPSLSRQVSGDDPVMLTAPVSRVMAAPMSQQATVTNKVKRRETDFEPPRMSAAKNLSSMLQRFADTNDDDLDPELCISPPERRGYNLVRSAHSTSDMHDLSFQERFSSHNRNSSSRSSSIGKYENALSPVSFNNSIDNENVITMRLEIPLIQNTTSPSPTQYYQAQFTNPPPPPIILSPPTQRRTSSFNTSSHHYNDVPRDLSPRDVPSFAPLRKCESWHQLAYTKQRPQSLALPPSVSPRRSPTNAKIQMFSKQFEAKMSIDSIEDKQKQVQAYLLQQDSSVSNTKAAKQKREIPAYNRQDTLRRYVNDEDLENVDEVFESLFKDSVKSKSKVNSARSIAPPPQQSQVYSGFTSNVTNSSKNFQRRQQSWEESSGVRTWLVQSVTPPSPIAGKQSESTVITSGDSSSRTEVQTKTSSFSSSMSTSTRVSKAAPPSKLQMSPFAKFKQLDEKNSSPSPSSPKTPGGSTTPLFKFTDPGLNRSASNVKEKLLYWCQVKTKEYKDLKIENFSTSWSDGMAFCALIHHFGPENFNYNILSPEKRRKNFELAFKVAEEKFDIAPLLDVDDMVMMKKPDWKCVFTYVQSIYRRFKDELD